MKNYSDFLTELENLKIEQVYLKRLSMFRLLENRLNTLSLSIQYQKSKHLYSLQADILEQGEILAGFFGNNDIKVQEKMLSQLWKKLEEIKVKGKD